MYFPQNVHSVSCFPVETNASFVIIVQTHTHKHTHTHTLIHSCSNSHTFILSLSYFLTYLSRSLADRWGTTVDFTTSFLHSYAHSQTKMILQIITFTNCTGMFTTDNWFTLLLSVQRYTVCTITTSPPPHPL